jgi:hypothetical protein
VPATIDLSDPLDPAAKAIRDLIDLDGGPLVPSVLGASLRNMDFLHAVTSVSFLEEALNTVSAANSGPGVSVHLTRSLSVGGTVRMIDATHAAVLIPVGTLARMRVMHRLLLSNWNREGKPLSVMASVMDRPVTRAVPQGLVPLLSDAQDETAWWTALDALDAETTLDPRFNPDVSELDHLSLSLLIGHEFAHVLRHHPDIRTRVRAGELSFEVGNDKDRRPGTDVELRRAMEGDADMVSAYMAVATLVRQGRSAGFPLPRGFVRLGYAVTALFGLFDPRRLSIMDYGTESQYAHPLIRYSNYMDDFGDCARQVNAADDYEGNADFGVLKCQIALSWLESDIMTEHRFGGPVDGDPTIHALRHSETFLLRVARMQQEERALALRLGTLITSAYGEFQLAR